MRSNKDKIISEITQPDNFIEQLKRILIALSNKTITTEAKRKLDSEGRWT